MKILYYTWHEISEYDMFTTLKKLYIDVDKLDFAIKDKLNDIPFTEKLSSILDNTRYDCIFSTNYFPIISKIAYAYGIKYVSWTYDSNPLFYYSKTIFNNTNYLITYDYTDFNHLVNLGIEHIMYLPMGVNIPKIDNLLVSNQTDNTYDVTFLGTLYDDEFNFYDQIHNMPEYYKGYIDSIIDAQMDLYGIDLTSLLITDEFFSKISHLINFNLDDELFITPRELFIGFIQKKITVKERFKLINEISNKFKLTHFAANGNAKLNKVDFRGYANYDTEMPIIFNSSKINLNITLRANKTAIPLRCMDIMGAGGFLLSNYQQELAELFENGSEIVMYESHEDALNKIDYYLSHEKERKEIAVNGRRKIENNYTYDIAFKKIFEFCELV